MKSCGTVQLNLKIVLSSFQTLSHLTLFIHRPTLTSESPTEKMKRLLDINVNGVFYTAREAACRMIPRGSGSIILISSMSANVRFMPDTLQVTNHFHL